MEKNPKFYVYIIDAYWIYKFYNNKKKCPCSEGTVLATNPAVSFSRSYPYINCLKSLQEFFRESDNLIEYSVRQGILAHFPKLRYTVKTCEGIFSRFGSMVALWVYIKPKTFFPEIFFSSVCRGKMAESAREYPKGHSRAAPGHSRAPARYTLRGQ